MKDSISLKPGMQMYGYYTGIFQAGCSIWKEQGLKGLYAGYMPESTLSIALNSAIFCFINTDQFVDPSPTHSGIRKFVFRAFTTNNDLVNHDQAKISVVSII